MLDIAQAIAAATIAHSGFGWYTTRSALPDPRGYRLDITDDDTVTVWIDGTLDVASGYTALVAAIDELLGATGNVIPLRRPAPRKETEPEALEG